MAGRGRRNADDALAIALGPGRRPDAAPTAGIGERTATRRWANPEFQARFRIDMVGRAVGELPI